MMDYANGMTPLVAAATFCSRPTFEKLLDAGGTAAVERDGLGLLGQRPCLYKGAIISGNHENVSLILARYPQYANAVNPDSGCCPLHMACGTAADRGQKQVMEALLASPAKESLNSVIAPFYGSVLGTACKFSDQDPETVRMLLKAGADPSKPEVLMPLAVRLRRMTWVGKTLFGNVQARGFHKMLAALPARFKQSPTHIAAKKGDLALVKVLAEHEKFPVAQYEDTKGRTPVALAVNDTVKTAFAEIVGPAAVATPVPANKVAPEP